jgi:hypothetical protein
MRGSSLRGLRLSVTLFGFCPPDIPTGVVTLRTAPTPTPGRVAATLIAIPRSRARCVAFRHRGLQKRAVERCGLNGAPQAEQAALTTQPPTRRHQSGRRAIFDATRTIGRRLSWRAKAHLPTDGTLIARIDRLPWQSPLRPKSDQGFDHHW